jgi:hypothetical protein
MSFKALVCGMILLPAFAFAKTMGFNCQNLSGTYECTGDKNSAGAMIEMNGQEITYLNDAQMPLVYKASTKAGETSSEKQHVAYSSSCRKDRIEIASTVTELGATNKTSNMHTRLQLDEKGDLLSQSTDQEKESFGKHGTICTRVRAE